METFTRGIWEFGDPAKGMVMAVGTKVRIS